MLHPKKFLLLISFVTSFCAVAQWNDSLLKPFELDHRRAASSLVNLSFLLDAPAGKEGFIRVHDGHLVKPNGKRIRFWGVHLTDWSPGSVLLPPKEDTSMWADTLARFGVNLVRLHFLDLAAPRGIIDAGGNNTQSFDAGQLDRLDFLISELKKRGIYVDLNLNVGRSYKAGDGVEDADKIRWAKGVILYDPRLIELQKDYARKLLTHVNAYTGLEYRNDPVMAIVEIANENGIGVGFHAPSMYYDQELGTIYNSWLAQNRTADEIKRLRVLAGVAADGAIPRLSASGVDSAPVERYRSEVAFYMDIEKRFYQDMSRYLKTELEVKSPIVGTADHGHSGSSYPMLVSLSQLDIVDGHVYWEHPGAPPPTDTPMVNDPLHSTIVQLSRTAFEGKPYTVSETNHPFPNEWASEGMPITAAYGSFQDWDAIVTYTFEPKAAATGKSYVGDPFDISLDPVRMTEFAACALTFLRQDVHPARQTIERTYSAEQTIDSRRLPPSEQPYFTPGFPLVLPLEHGVRIRSLHGPPTEDPKAEGSADPIISDTGELSWFRARDHGVVTVDTERSQALIGFVKSEPKSLTNLSADIENNFATIVLVSIDAKPISRSEKLLLTTGSRVANTGMQWNEAHTKLLNQGGPPSLIEPVTGTIMLRRLEGATSVAIVALDGGGRAIGDEIPAKKTAEGWAIRVGNTVTTWYAISVRRR